MSKFRSSLPRIWWLSPGWVFSLMLLPFVYVAYNIPNEEYTISWKTNRFFDDEDLAICLKCAGAFLVAGFFCWLLRPRRTSPSWGRFEPQEIAFTRRCYYWGLGFTLFGYFAWTLLALHNGVTPAMVLSVFTGSGAFDVKNMTGTWPGITTATQFGPAVFILGTILSFNGLRREMLLSLGPLLVIVFFRSIIYSERLAFFEVLVPTLVLVFFYLRGRFRGLFTGLFSVLWPIIAVAFIYLLFVGTEYFRSWPAYQSEYSSVWTFSRDRLSGYYITALNNGSLAYRVFGRSEFPFETFSWMVRFPILGSSIMSNVTVNYDMTYGDLLQLDANPEFNNASGVFSYAQDWGEPGVYIFFFLFGAVVFSAYYSFLCGGTVGLLLYPFLVLGVVEIARIAYLTNSRIFPTWAGLLFVLLGLRRIHKMAEIRSREARQLSVIEAQPLPSGPAPKGALSDIFDAPAEPTRK